MKTKAMLLYKSYMTYFPTSLPVYFYGLPDNKIYSVYTRFYEINFNNSGLEFVFAEQEDFAINYETGQIITREYLKIDLSDFKEIVDRPDPRLKILKVLRNLNTYSDAQVILNQLAAAMGNVIKLAKA
jgi:hypothetical protein